MAQPDLLYNYDSDEYGGTTDDSPIIHAQSVASSVTNIPETSQEERLSEDDLGNQLPAWMQSSQYRYSESPTRKKTRDSRSSESSSLHSSPTPKKARKRSRFGNQEGNYLST